MEQKGCGGDGGRIRVFFGGGGIKRTKADRRGNKSDDQIAKGNEQSREMRSHYVIIEYKPSTKSMQQVNVCHLGWLGFIFFLNTKYSRL